MTTISQEIQINAPRKHVWSILANLGGIQSFHPVVQKSYYITEQKEGIGACRICEMTPKGQVTEKVSEWRAHEYMKLDIIDGKGMPPFKSAYGTLSLRDTKGGGTAVRLTMIYGLKMGPFGRLMDKLMVRSQFSKMIPLVLGGLKHHAETGEEVDMAVAKKHPVPVQAASKLELAVA